MWDRLALAACLVVSVASAAWFTRGTYYFQDDYMFLRQARTKQVNLAYFRENMFQHFSPVSRLGNLLVARYLPGQPDAAHWLAVAIFGCCVAAFAWTVTGLTGRTWWRHLLTLAFGESLATVHFLGWWTAALNILPATLFGLLTIGCYLRYRQARGRQWAVLSVAAYTISLCTHEQSWLVFGYLLLIEVLILNAGQRIRDAVLRLRQHWTLWLLYAVLTVLGIANYMEYYYAPTKPRPTISQLARFTGITFGQGLAPSIVGFRPLSGGVVSSTTAIVDSLIVFAFIGVTMVMVRSSWRAWALFAIGFLANTYMTGANRVGLYGPAFGRQMYYVESPAYLFLLCAAAVFSLPQRLPVRAHLSRERPRRRPPVAVTAGVVAVGVVAYQAAYLTSAHALETKEPNEVQAHAARLYFEKIFKGLDAVRRRGGTPSLLDGPIPPYIVFASFAPFNQLSSALQVVRPGVVVNRLGPETFAVGQDGSLIHAGFVQLDPPGYQQPGTTNMTIGQGVQTLSAASHCYQASPAGTVAVHVGPVHPGATTWLKLRLTTYGAGNVFVSLTSPTTGVSLGAITLQSQAGTADYLIQTGSIATFDTIVLALGNGERICLASTSVGTFAPIP